MYTVIDGKQYDIVPYNYTNQEIAVAQSMSSLPYTRFKLKGVKDAEKILSVGNTVSLYFSTSDAKDVLTVGNDSIYEENNQKFVYVKTDSSEMASNAHSLIQDEHPQQSFGYFMNICPSSSLFMR